jgi:phosphatidyl-myo-inositol dimannoside synthase
MKVVLLTGNFPPEAGGISEHLGILAKCLPQELLVIGLPLEGWQAYDAQQNYRIKRLSIPGGWNTLSSKYKYLAPLYYKELRKEINCEYILCGEAHHTLMLPAWFVQKQLGIPYGVFTYGKEMLHRQKDGSRFLFNPLLRAAQNVFPDSQRAGEIARDIGVQSDKLHIIHPSVKIERVNKSANPDLVRQKFGLQGKKIVLSVGRLVERKGQDMLIRALPGIIAKVPDVHYLIAGRGPYETQLKTLARNMNIDSHITFAGFVPENDLGSYYASCDVFAMISREIPEEGDIEGFGIVYLEANLLGKAVVAGRSGGVSDAVLDGQTGLLVDPESSSEVAGAIIKLLSDPALANRFGEAGRVRALNEFSGRSAAQKLCSVITQKQH